MSITHTLFLSSNLNPDSPLSVDKEFNRVRERLRGVNARWVSGIDHWPDVRLDQLPGQLLAGAHTIIHFSGHCGDDGALNMRDHDGRPVPLDPDGLAALIGEFSDSVRLVVLNACFSEALAVKLVEHVDVVVGMRTVVSDDAGVLFAPTFYEALASGRSVGKAFKIAKALVGARYKDQARTLQCHERGGVDAHQVFITLAPASNPAPPAPAVRPQPGQIPVRPAQPDPGQRVGPTRIGEVALTLKQKDELTALLMRCPYLSQSDDRQAVYDRLPIHLRGQLGGGNNLITRMSSLVSNCARFPDGIDQLIAALRHFEGHTTLMGEIDAWTWTVRGS